MILVIWNFGILDWWVLKILLELCIFKFDLVKMKLFVVFVMIVICFFLELVLGLVIKIVYDCLYLWLICLWSWCSWFNLKWLVFIIIMIVVFGIFIFILIIVVDIKIWFFLFLKFCIIVFFLLFFICLCIRVILVIFLK